MKRFFRAFGFFVLVQLMLFRFPFSIAYAVEPTDPPASSPPATASTSESCMCFCTSESGAQKMSSVTNTNCQKLCAQNGQRVAVCAYKPSQYPANIAYCFSQEQCKKQNGEFSKTQAPECPTGMSYCYPDPATALKTKLNVSIGSMMFAADFGEYAQNLINWFYTSGIVIVVVIIMIGGFQYVLGAAKPDQVKAGKARIINAVIGLVLLMSSWVILHTVNPYLIRLGLPKYPLIKQIDLPQGKPCEELENEYIITDVTQEKTYNGTNQKCGVSGVVKEKKGGGAVAGGITCFYRTCEDKTKGCVISGDKGTCAACQDVVPDNELGIKPSSGVCNQLKRKVEPITLNGATYKNTANYCFYTHDPSALISGWRELGIATSAFVGGPVGLVAGGALTTGAIGNLVKGACAELIIDCKG